MDEDEVFAVPFDDGDLEGSGTQFRTYRMDFEKKRIIGMVEGIDAAAQSIFKELQTRRFSYLIYDEQYGCDIFNKIGNASLTESYLDNDVPAMIEDALVLDEMVTGVSDFEFEIIDRDAVMLEFSVSTIYGEGSFEGVITDG